MADPILRGTETAPILCPACHGADVAPWFTKASYEHYRCVACGHGFVAPVPDRESLNQYYRELSSGYSSGCSWAMEPKHKLKLWSDLLARAGALGAAGSLIDIGCGSGAFLELARELGWCELHGIEIAPGAARQAAARSAGTIHEGAWREMDSLAGRFDVVTLFDVLEHDPEPDALLGFSRRLLRTGGVLLLTVPHVSGLSMRVFQQRAYTVIPPEHLAYYGPLSLRTMLERACFEVSDCFTCDIYIKEWLRFLPSGRAASGGESSSGGWDEATYRSAYGRLTGAASLRMIGLANRGLRMAGLGDQLVAVARATESRHA